MCHFCRSRRERSRGCGRIGFGERKETIRQPWMSNSMAGRALPVFRSRDRIRHRELRGRGRSLSWPSDFCANYTRPRPQITKCILHTVLSNFKSRDFSIKYQIYSYKMSLYFVSSNYKTNYGQIYVLIIPKSKRRLLFVDVGAIRKLLYKLNYCFVV